MNEQGLTLRLAMVLAFILLGPIAVAAVGAPGSVALLALTWGIAITLLLLTVRRLSRRRRRLDHPPEHGDRGERGKRDGPSRRREGSPPMEGQ